ncbi:MAG: putative transporter [Saprospiraceae bacterium]|nr:putative transporter [Saprospiraceae bacterium]
MISELLKLFRPTSTPDVGQSLILLILTIAFGIFIGRIKIKKVSLGIAAVMFSGLLFGHLGYSIDEKSLGFLRELGLILFVYAIGVQVGPSFFSSLRKEGLRFNILAISTVLVGGMVTFAIFKYSGQSIEHSVGLMSGAVTNTPGLGAAKSTLVELKNSFPTKEFGDPAIPYAIAYPFGVLGIILMLIITKSVFKIDLEKEEKELNAGIDKKHNYPTAVKCRVINEAPVGMSLKEVLAMFEKDAIIFSRLKHSGSEIVYSPEPDYVIRDRDVLMVVGHKEHVEKAVAFLGRPSSDIMVESNADIHTHTLIVTKHSAVHKTLSELALYNRYDMKVTRVYRSGMEFLATGSFELFFGDKLVVVGNKYALEQAEQIVGNSEKRLLEPDFLSIFGGLILGILVGSIPIFIPSFPVPVKMGFAAGPLIVALLLSRYGGVGMIHTYINHGAIYFMKDLGICLFFATVGIHAGKHFYENFVAFNGWTWISYGLCITLIPLFLMVIIGRFVLKINFLQLAGLMSGTYTDPAALSFSNSYFKSDVPAQAYATVYPMVTIFRILVAQLLILLFA